MSNQLHYCPNCAYLLVLLARRGKYKCAKCGKLFLQKDIESNDFREWDKKQKLLDIQNLKKPRVKLSEEERKKRAKESINKWRVNNKEKVREYEKKRDRKEYQLLWYHKNLDKLRSDGRLKQWRQKQKILAIDKLKEIEGLYLNNDISHNLKWKY